MGQWKTARTDELIVEVLVQELPLFEFRDIGAYGGVEWSTRSIWCTLSSTENAEEAVAALQDLKPEFCVFGGERIIDEGGICAAAARSWADEGSGISEALGEHAGVP